MTAVPASIKFDQNPDWIAYKQMNSNMKKAWATVAAKKGSHHLKAHVDGERAAGICTRKSDIVDAKGQCAMTEDDFYSELTVPSCV